jgi:hypothetical protein
VKVLFCLLAGVLLAAGSANAQTYSLADDWNSGSDVASNQWSYGTFSSGTTFVVPSTAANSGSTVNFWTFPPVGDSDTADPNIEKNISSSAYISSNVDFRAGTVSFGPFQGPAVAQFIAPTTGLYSISATFQTDQIRAGSTGDGTTAYVYVGGLDKYTQLLSDPGSAQYGTAVTYSASSLALSAGEAVDFAVGGGAFTTEVDATLSVVPEPSAWAMLLGGLALSTFVARHRMVRAL